jgi:hypothetical protein
MAELLPVQGTPAWTAAKQSPTKRNIKKSPHTASFEVPLPRVTLDLQPCKGAYRTEICGNTAGGQSSNKTNPYPTWSLAEEEEEEGFISLPWLGQSGRTNLVLP